MNVTINTTKDSVYSWSKTELVAYCKANDLDSKGLKEELAYRVWTDAQHKVAALKQEKAEKEAAEAAAQQAALEADNADPMSQALTQGFVQFFKDIVTKNEEYVVKFKEAVATGDLHYALEWKADEAVKAQELITLASPFVAFMQRTDKYTFEQKLDILRAEFVKCGDRCMDNHATTRNSTCQWTNLVSQKKFHALQDWSRSLRAVIKSVARAKEMTPENATLTVASTYVW